MALSYQFIISVYFTSESAIHILYIIRPDGVHRTLQCLEEGYVHQVAGEGGRPKILRKSPSVTVEIEPGSAEGS